MVKDLVLIHIDADKAFRRSAQSFEVKIQCVKEADRCNWYSIEATDMNDVLNLGISMGRDFQYEVQKEKLKTKYS